MGSAVWDAIVTAAAAAAFVVGGGCGGHVVGGGCPCYSRLPVAPANEAGPSHVLSVLWVMLSPVYVLRQALVLRM